MANIILVSHYKNLVSPDSKAYLDAGCLFFNSFCTISFQLLWCMKI